MRRFALGASLAVCSVPVSAGIIVDIKLSRSVPEMVAEAIWSDPIVASSRARPASALPKAVLWESAVTVTQRAVTASVSFEVAGSMPARVPEGALFTGWRLNNGLRVMCTQDAEEPGIPGKPRYAVCIPQDSGGRDVNPLAEAKVRKLGKHFDDSVPGQISGAAFRPGFDPADNVKTRPWAGPVNFFSYKQVAEKGALLREPTGAGTGMAVSQLSIGNRLVLGAIKGNTAVLEHRQFDLDDFTAPISERKDSGYKEGEVTVDLSSGPKTVDLGGGRFLISRTADGSVQAEEEEPMKRKGSIETGTGRFLFDDERPYTIGAQEI
jgi:hypothetical protein